MVSPDNSRVTENTGNSQVSSEISIYKADETYGCLDTARLGCCHECLPYLIKSYETLFQTYDYKTSFSIPQ